MSGAEHEGARHHYFHSPRPECLLPEAAILASKFGPVFPSAVHGIPLLFRKPRFGVTSQGESVQPAKEAHRRVVEISISYTLTSQSMNLRDFAQK